MARKKRLDPDAEQIAIYLTPTEQLVLDVVSPRRKKRDEIRTSPSEIVADGLWKILAEVEGIERKIIEQLVKVEKENTAASVNVKAFPKKT